MMKNLFKKGWHWLLMLSLFFCFILVTVILILLTLGPQEGPFIYQIH